MDHKQALLSLVQACTLMLPKFLQPWKRQVLLAGLQLRLLAGLPHPMCQVATALTTAATAEAAALRAASGAHLICLCIVRSHCIHHHTQFVRGIFRIQMCQ